MKILYPLRYPDLSVDYGLMPIPLFLILAARKPV
jgi:hypothetical protein